MSERTPDIDAIESMIPRSGAVEVSISSWSVGQHLHHCLLGTCGICSALVRSTPGARRQSFSPLRFLILLFGRIPRGRGKSPPEALPDRDVTDETLHHLVAQAREAVAAARRCHRRCWWKHFLFGVMERNTALRFVRIHNEHHLRIARDILAAGS